MKEALKAAGFNIVDEGPMFNEFVVDFGRDAEEVSRHLLEHGMIGGLPLGTYEGERQTQMLVCATELRTKEEIDQFVEVVGGMK
jgi:glycine dehydrogenase subunit 1